MVQLLPAASDVDETVSPAKSQLSVTSRNHALSFMRTDLFTLRQGGMASTISTCKPRGTAG